jgi:hypothetical protein
MTPLSQWPAGGGDMGRQIRVFDWSLTPLGPVALWPRSLRSTVTIVLDHTQRCSKPVDLAGLENTLRRLTSR